MSRDERSLYTQIAAGDGAAFATLIQPYQHQLSKFVSRQLAGDTRAVEDVLQETYLAAYRAVAVGTRPENIRSWLFTIARNQASNARRSCKPVTRLDESVTATNASCPAGAVEQGEWMAWLMSAISELPVRQRTALVEHVFEGRSYGEIAQRQQTTVGAVKTRLHRARQGLTQSAGLRSAFLPGMAWISRVVPRRTHAVAIGKLGAKSVLVGQAVAAVVFATGALIVVKGFGVPPVRASGITLTGKAHPRHASAPRRHRTASGGRGLGPAGHGQVRREGEHAIRQCTNGEKLSKRLSVPGLAYAIVHLPTDVHEYTDCAEIIFAGELRAAERGHHHPERGHHHPKRPSKPHAGGRGRDLKKLAATRARGTST